MRSFLNDNLTVKGTFAFSKLQTDIQLFSTHHYNTDVENSTLCDKMHGLHRNESLHPSVSFTPHLLLF